MPHASLYRMVTPDHICPFGLKARDLLRRKGYTLDDHHLTSRAETDAFMDAHGVETTPQVFIEDRRIGGYDSLKRFFGKHVAAKGDVTYAPVVAIFATAFLLALAWQWREGLALASMQAVGRFVALAMCLLAVMKLRDLEGFSNQFLGYDLLAQRIVRYAYVYPFAELFAGLCMLAGLVPLWAAGVALFIGTIGAVSVIKAVYLDKRELRCACVGGDSRVPLGAISLTENLMMVAMGLAMLGSAALG